MHEWSQQVGSQAHPALSPGLLLNGATSTEISVQNHLNSADIPVGVTHHQTAPLLSNGRLCSSSGVRNEQPQQVENYRAIRSVMEAVKQGELDIQIEDVAEQGTAELRLRAPLKPVKKVS